MLLKCRYLAQFSVSELTKNAAQVSKAAEHCPFMAHARRSLVTSSLATESAAVDMAKAASAAQPVATMMQQQQESRQQQQYEEEFLSIKEHRNVTDEKKPLGCTDTINCPFFKSANLDLNKLLEVREAGQDDITWSSSKAHAVKRPIKDQAKPEPKRQHKLSKAHVAKENVAPAAAVHPATRTTTFDYEQFFAQKIEAKKRDGSYRYFKKVTRNAANFPLIQEHSACGQSAKDITRRTPRCCSPRATWPTTRRCSR
jgi:hypothetical protein